MIKTEVNDVAAKIAKYGKMNTASLDVAIADLGDADATTEGMSCLELFDQIESQIQVLNEIQDRVSFLGKEVRYLLKLKE